MSWKQTIDSVAKLELLLFFHQNPSTMDSASSLAVWAGIEQAEAERALGELAEQGLVRRSGTIYQYAPGAELEPLVRGAVEAYRAGRSALRAELARTETERRSLARSLATERGRGEAVLRSIGEGIVLLEPDGRARALNLRALELLGTGRLERLDELVPEAREALRAALERPSETVELALGARVLRVRASALAGDGDAPAAGSVLTLYDVTRQVEAERLRQDLTRMITHDLRSPVSGISTAFDLLLREGAEQLPAKQRRIAEVGRRSANYILGLVNNLLDIGRLEDGRLVLEPALYFLEEIADAALAQLEGLVGDRTLHLRRLWPPESRTPVRLDRDLVVRIVLNLAGNAVKFSPRGSALEVDCGQRGAEAFVSVRDHGEGIPEDELPRVFDKYYRVAGGKASQVGGTGLGLYFVRLVADAHGGRIEAENVPPAGCRFTLLLPAARP